MFCTIKHKVGILLLTGLSLATVGLVTYVIFPTIMHSEILKRMVLSEGSESYKFWKDIPVPIYIHFYFFNIKNPDEVWARTNKPILEELGPYTFREAREKVNITWNDNGTVSYRQIKKWYFQPDKTNGSLDDIITTVNVPMIAAAATGKAMNNAFVYFAMGQMFSLTGSTWFVWKSVRQLLFEGYSDPLIDAAKQFMKMPYDKFGWFYQRNATDDGEFVIYTGENDITKFDEVQTWNGNASVSAYDPPCNMINGSAGDMWPPGPPKYGQISMFITDICRSMSFQYLKEVEIQSLKAYRYYADKSQLDNGKFNPDNKCFCKGGTCLPPGAVNVSVCKFDAPAVVSYPHFLFADTSYGEGVIGLRPDPQLHEMFLDIEPNMGIPLQVAARMQINIVFEGVPEITQFANITGRTFIPTIWFSETAIADDNIVGQLKLVLRTLPLAADVVAYILITVGSLLVLSALVLSILFAKGKIKDHSSNSATFLVVDERTNRTEEKQSSSSYRSVKTEHM